MGTPNYYELLGISPEATQEEIKRAYFALARQYHPDVNPSPNAKETFLRIQEAYTTLSDPQKRLLYDQRLAEQEQHAALLKIKTILSQSHLAKLKEPQILYALLEISPTHHKQNLKRPPLNVCLLLDRSTSMKGEWMQALKRAAALLVEELRADDVFSVVAFDDRAEVIVPAKRGQNKESILQKINQIRPQGGTEIYRGLLEAYRQVGRFYSPNSLNSIILLTDGHTYGDEHKCERLARQAAKQNIIIHGAGLGAEWNDAFMDKIAGITGGASIYIRSSRDISRLLEEQFHKVGKLFASKVELLFSLSQGVRLQYAFRLSPEPMPLKAESPIMLGGVPSEGNPLRVIFEFLIPPIPQNVENFIVLTSAINAYIPSAGKKVHIPWSIGLPLGEEANPVPPEIASALTKITMYRMQEQAKREIAAGNINKATRKLENLATRLLQVGEPQLAAVVQKEARRLQLSNSLSPEGEKEIKFGTRALILPAEFEKRE